jgi:hypothetical protein
METGEALQPADQNSPALTVSNLSRSASWMARDQGADATWLQSGRAEERRLLKLHGQSLAQPVVKDRNARLVVEVRKNNRIVLGQLGSGP